MINAKRGSFRQPFHTAAVYLRTHRTGTAVPHTERYYHNLPNTSCP